MIPLLDHPFCVEAHQWVFNQLRSQKSLMPSSETEGEKNDNPKKEEPEDMVVEDKVASLEAFFKEAKLEAVASASQPAVPCYIHSGSVRLMK